MHHKGKIIVIFSIKSIQEAQHGVSGFRVTEERLEKVSGEKAAIDQEKGKTLAEMSAYVLQLNQSISSRKAQLAPIIKGSTYLQYNLSFI